MRSFRHRRWGRGGAREKRAPWLVPLICAVAAVLVTVIIGNLLRLWVDEDTMRRLTEGEDKEDGREVVFEADVRDVHAYAHALGVDSVERVFDFPDTSVLLNAPDGRTAYSSEVADFFGLDSFRAGVDLLSSMEELRGVATYISGVFYCGGIPAESDNLIYAGTAVDRALIYEFLQAGGSEVLLCGLPFGEVPDSVILEYVSAIKSTVGQCPLGVVIPVSVAQQADSWELLGGLLRYCDLLALDLRGSDVALSDCSYYITGYSMRVILSTEDEERIEQAIQYLNDFQTVEEAPAAE